MKKLILVLVGLVLVQMSAFAESYAVKADASEVKWTATKVTGKHFGKINVVSGAVEFTDGKFSGGEATIDATSLTVEDLSGKGKDKLTGHLKSDDFFSVEKFPTATIKITEVKPAGENLYDVTADLTIKGVTKPVSFQANVVKNESGVTATAAISIDRTAYDIRYGSGKFFENLGDKTIHDTFTLDVSISAA
jgi:polyisoprenoid-binding protein YceI